MKILTLMFAILLTAAFVSLTLNEVNAASIDKLDHACTHYPGYEWDEYDEGTGIFVNAWSNVSDTYFDYQNWYFEREIGYLAQWDNLGYGSLSCLRLSNSWSTMDYASAWSDITWRSNPGTPPPYGQYYYIQQFGVWNFNNPGDYSQLIHTYLTGKTWCCDYATAYFYMPDSQEDLWYCSTSAFVSV
jgi:hypothetical protein